MSASSSGLPGWSPNVRPTFHSNPSSLSFAQCREESYRAAWWTLIDNAHRKGEDKSDVEPPHDQPLYQTALTAITTAKGKAKSFKLIIESALNASETKLEEGWTSLPRGESNRTSEEKEEHEQKTKKPASQDGQRRTTAKENKRSNNNRSNSSSSSSRSTSTEGADAAAPIASVTILSRTIDFSRHPGVPGHVRKSNKPFIWRKRALRVMLYTQYQTDVMQIAEQELPKIAHAGMLFRERMIELYNISSVKTKIDTDQWVISEQEVDDAMRDEAGDMKRKDEQEKKKEQAELNREKKLLVKANMTSSTGAVKQSTLPTNSVPLRHTQHHRQSFHPPVVVLGEPVPAYEVFTDDATRIRRGSLQRAADDRLNQKPLLVAIANVPGRKPHLEIFDFNGSMVAELGALMFDSNSVSPIQVRKRRCELMIDSVLN